MIDEGRSWKATKDIATLCEISGKESCRDDAQHPRLTLSTTRGYDVLVPVITRNS